MVSMQEVITTCDRVVRGKKCGHPAVTYTVCRDDEALEIDLCDQHAETLWGMVEREGRVSTIHEPKRRTMKSSVREWQGS